MMIIKEGEIKLRELEESDLELLMSWRSNSELYKWFYLQNGALLWENHYNWWKSRKDRVDWIIIYDEESKERRVGSANISDLESEHPEVGILIGEITLWGKGVASKALKMVISYLKDKGYKGASANIFKKNKNSRRLFERNGFTMTGVARKGELSYDLIFN